MEETFVINQVKEDCCFVSQNFKEDMKTSRKKYPENTIMRDYVLPDFTSIRRGFLREPVKNMEEDCQVLKVNNERFVIPEVLFHPSDIGITQMGVAEATVYAINNCPEETRPHMFSNIVICGGSSLFFGMRQRLTAEIRSMTPDEYEVNVTLPKDAISFAWQGGKVVSQSDDFLQSCMSRKEYEENGSKYSLEKFDI